MKFQATGVAATTQALTDLTKRVTDETLRRRLISAAQPVADRASQLAPRGPGGGVHLADEIVVSVVDDQHGNPAVAVGPTTGAFYGGFLEFGTVKMAARPFLRPAWDTESPKALDAMGDGIWQDLTR